MGRGKGVSVSLKKKNVWQAQHFTALKTKRNSDFLLKRNSDFLSKRLSAFAVSLLRGPRAQLLRATAHSSRYGGSFHN